MSKVTIKCDQMAGGWNYDTCPMCRYFSTGSTIKSPYWRCKLNRDSASEDRKFSGIWAINYLNYRGMSIQEDEIIIEYVGKRKKRGGK